MSVLFISGPRKRASSAHIPAHAAAARQPEDAQRYKTAEQQCRADLGRPETQRKAQFRRRHSLHLKMRYTVRVLVEKSINGGNMGTE